MMRYLPDFLSTSDARSLWCWLHGEGNVNWQTEQFRIFGRTVAAPRQVAWFGDVSVNYRYTGLDHVAQGWPDVISTVLEQIHEVSEQHFNFVLLNRYLDGGHYMGWHRDDERGADALIASLSLGAARRFRVRSEPGETSTTLELAGGSLLLFDGTRQHTLPVTRRQAGERVNLTFRTLRTEQPVSAARGD